MIGHSYLPGEDPKTYIAREHAEIRSYLTLAASSLAAGSRASARRTLRRARTDIEQHFAAEEADVFPLWAELHPDLAPDLAARIAEHPRLLRMLRTLDSRPFTRRELAKFITEIEAHAAREERLFAIIAGR